MEYVAVFAEEYFSLLAQGLASFYCQKSIFVQKDYVQLQTLCMYHIRPLGALTAASSIIIHQRLRATSQIRIFQALEKEFQDFPLDSYLTAGALQ